MSRVCGAGCCGCLVVSSAPMHTPVARYLLQYDSAYRWFKGTGDPYWTCHDSYENEEQARWDFDELTDTQRIRYDCEEWRLVAVVHGELDRVIGEDTERAAARRDWAAAEKAAAAGAAVRA